MARRSAKVPKPSTRQKDSGGASAPPAEGLATTAAALGTAVAKEHLVSKPVGNNPAGPPGERPPRSGTTSAAAGACGERSLASTGLLDGSRLPTAAARGVAACAAAAPDKTGSTGATRTAEGCAELPDKEGSTAAARKTIDGGEAPIRERSNGAPATALAAERDELLARDKTTGQRESVSPPQEPEEIAAATGAIPAAVETGARRSTGTTAGKSAAEMTAAGMRAATPTGAAAEGGETRAGQLDKSAFSVTEPLTPSTSAANTSSSKKRTGQCCAGGGVRRQVGTKGQGEQLAAAAAANVACLAIPGFAGALCRTAAAEAAAAFVGGGRPATVAFASPASESVAGVAVISAAIADTVGESDRFFLTSEVRRGASPPKTARSAADSRTSVTHATTAAAEWTEGLFGKCTESKPAGESEAGKAAAAAAATSDVTAQKVVLPVPAVSGAAATYQPAQPQRATGASTRRQATTPAASRGSAEGTGTAGRQAQEANVTADVAVTSDVPLLPPRKAAAEATDSVPTPGEPAAAAAGKENGKSVAAEEIRATTVVGCRGGRAEPAAYPVTRGRSAELRVAHSKGSDLQMPRFGMAWSKKQESLRRTEDTGSSTSTKPGSDWKANKAAEATNPERGKGSNAKDRPEEHKDKPGGAAAAVTSGSTSKSVAASSGSWAHSRESSSSRRSSRESKQWNRTGGNSNSFSSRIDDSTNVTRKLAEKQAANTQPQGKKGCEGSTEQAWTRKRTTEGVTDVQQSGEKEENFLQQQDPPKDRDTERRGHSSQLQSTEEKKCVRPNRDKEQVAPELSQKRDEQQDKQQKEKQEQRPQTSQDSQSDGNGSNPCLQEKQEVKVNLEQAQEPQEEWMKGQQNSQAAETAKLNSGQKRSAQNAEEFRNNTKKNAQSLVDRDRRALVFGNEAEIREGAPDEVQAATTGRSAIPFLAGPAAKPSEITEPARRATTEAGTIARAAALPGAVAEQNPVQAETDSAEETAEATASAVADAEGVVPAGKEEETATADKTLVTQATATATQENMQDTVTPPTQAADPRIVATPAAAEAEDKSSSKPLTKLPLVTAGAATARRVSSRVGARKQDLITNASNHSSTSSDTRWTQRTTDSAEKPEKGRDAATVVAKSPSRLEEVFSDITRAPGATPAEADVVAAGGTTEVVPSPTGTNVSGATAARERDCRVKLSDTGGESRGATLVVKPVQRRQDEADEETAVQQQQEKSSSLQQATGKQLWSYKQSERQDTGEQKREERRQEGVGADHELKGSKEEEATTNRCRREGKQPEEHQATSEVTTAEERVRPESDSQRQETRLPQEQELERGQKQQQEQEDDAQARKVSCPRCEKRFAEAIDVLPHLVRLLQQQPQLQKAGEEERQHDTDQQSSLRPHRHAADGGDQACSAWEEQRLYSEHDRHPTRQQHCRDETERLLQQREMWLSVGWEKQSVSEGLQQQTPKQMQAYRQEGRDEEEDKLGQGEKPLEWWADDAEEEHKTKEGTILCGEDLCSDDLRARIKEKVRELRRQQLQSRFIVQPFPEQADALRKELAHLKSQECVMQRQVSLLQKQLQHMDQQKATLEQQRRQLSEVQQLIRMRESQLLQTDGVCLLRQLPSRSPLTETATRQQRQEQQAKKTMQEHMVLREETKEDQQVGLQRKLVHHLQQHEEGKGEAVLAERQRRLVSLPQGEPESTPALVHPPQLTQEMGETPLLGERHWPLLPQLMQATLPHRLTPPLQHAQQGSRSPSPAQDGDHQEEESDEQFRERLQQHQQRRQQQKGFVNLLEQQENEDLAQAGVLPQHQQQHGDYTGSVSASLERILIKLTSSDSCLNLDAPADNGFLLTAPAQIPGSFPLCPRAEEQAAGVAPSAAAPFADPPVDTASKPAASSCASPAAVPLAAAAEAVLPQPPYSTRLCSSGTAEMQPQQGPQRKDMRREPGKDNNEGVLLLEEDRSTREHPRHATAERDGGAASVLRSAHAAAPERSERSRAAVLPPHHAESPRDIRDFVCQSSPASASAGVRGADALGATPGGPETASAGVPPAEGAPRSATATGSRPGAAASVCTYAAAGTQGSARTAPTGAPASRLPSAGAAALACSIPDVGAAAGAGAVTQAADVQPSASSPHTRTHREQKDQQYRSRYDHTQSSSTAAAEGGDLPYFLEGVRASGTADEQGTAAAGCKVFAEAALETPKATAAVAVLLEAWQWLRLNAEGEGIATEADAGAAAAREGHAHSSTQGERKQGEWQHRRGRHPSQVMLQQQPHQQGQSRERTPRVFEGERATSEEPFSGLGHTSAVTKGADTDAALISTAVSICATTSSAGQRAAAREASYAGNELHGETADDRMTALCSNATADVLLAVESAAASGCNTSTASGQVGTFASAETLVVAGGRMSESEQTAAVAGTANVTFSWQAVQRCGNPDDAAAEGLSQPQTSQWEVPRQGLKAEEHSQQQQSSVGKPHQPHQDREGNHPVGKTMRYSTVAEEGMVDEAPIGSQQLSLALDQRVARASLRLSAAAAAPLPAVPPLPPQPEAFSVRTASSSGVAAEYPSARVLSDAACPPVRAVPTKVENEDSALGSLSAEPVSTGGAAPAPPPEITRAAAVATGAVVLATTYPAAAAVTQSATEAGRLHPEATGDKEQCCGSCCERPPGTPPVFEEEGKRRECGVPEGNSTWSRSPEEQQRFPLPVQPLLPLVSVADRQSYDSRYLGATPVSAVGRTAPPGATGVALSLPVTTLHPAPATALQLPVPAATPAAAAVARPLGTASAASGLTSSEAAQSPLAAAPLPSSIAAARLSAKTRTVPAVGAQQPMAATAVLTETAGLPPVTSPMPQEVAEAPTTGQAPVLGSFPLLGSPYYAEMSSLNWSAGEEKQLRPQQDTQRHQQGCQDWQNREEEEDSHWKQRAEGEAHWGQPSQGGRQGKMVQQPEKQQAPMRLLPSTATHCVLPATDTLTPLSWRPSSSSHFPAQPKEKQLLLRQQDNRPQKLPLAVQLSSLPTPPPEAAAEASDVRISTVGGCYTADAVHTRRSELTPAAASRSRSAAPSCAPFAPPANPTSPPSSFVYASANRSAAALPAVLAAPPNHNRESRLGAVPTRVHDVAGCLTAASPVAAANFYEDVLHPGSPDSDAAVSGASSCDGLLPRVPPPPPPPPPPPQAASLLSQGLPQLPSSSAHGWTGPRLLVSTGDCTEALRKVAAVDLRALSSTVTATGDRQDFPALASAIRKGEADAALGTQRELTVQQQEGGLKKQQHNVQEQQQVEMGQLRQVGRQQHEGESTLNLAPLPEGSANDFISFPTSPSLVPQQYQPRQPELPLCSTGEQGHQQPRILMYAENELGQFFPTAREQQQRDTAEKQHLQQRQQRLGREEGNEQQQGRSCSNREEDKERTTTYDYFPMASQSSAFVAPPGDLLVQTVHCTKPLQVQQHSFTQQGQRQQRADGNTGETFHDPHELLPTTAAGGICVSDINASVACPFRRNILTAEVAAPGARKSTLGVPAAAIETRAVRRSPQSAAYPCGRWEEPTHQPAKHWSSSSSRHRTSSSNALAVCIGRVEEGARTRSPMASMAGGHTAKFERRAAAAGTKPRKPSAVVSCVGVAATADGPAQQGVTSHSRPYAEESAFASVAPQSKVAFPATTGGATGTTATTGRFPPERLSSDGSSLQNATEYESMMKRREASNTIHSGRGRASVVEATSAVAFGSRRTAYTQQQRHTRTRGQRFLVGGSSCSRYGVGQQRYGAAGWREDLTTAALHPPPPPLQEEGKDSSAAAGGTFVTRRVTESGFATGEAGAGAFSVAEGANVLPSGSQAPGNPTEGGVGPSALPPRKAAAGVESDSHRRRSSSAGPSGRDRRLLVLQQAGDTAGRGRHVNPHPNSGGGCRGGRQFLPQQSPPPHQQQYTGMGFGGARDCGSGDRKGQSSTKLETGSPVPEYSSSRSFRKGFTATGEGSAASGGSLLSGATMAAQQGPGLVACSCESLRMATAASSVAAAHSPPGVVSATAKARGGRPLAERPKPEGTAAAAAAKPPVAVAFRNENDALPAATGEIATGEPESAGRQTGLVVAAGTPRDGAGRTAAATAGSSHAAARDRDEEETRITEDNAATANVDAPATAANPTERRGDEEATGARGGGGANITTHVAAAETGSRRIRGAGKPAAGAERAGPTPVESAGVGATRHPPGGAAAAPTETKDGSRGEAAQGGEQKGYTTVMLRNIPNKYSRQQVMEEIDVHFKGTYNFFYLPIDFVHGCNVGYCFINFLDVATAEAFRQEFEGKRLSLFKSRKICSVTYGRMQGFKEILMHYSDSAVVQAQYASWRPVVLKDCVELPWSELRNVFPELFENKLPASSSSNASASSAGKRGSPSLSAAAAEKGHGSSSSSTTSSVSLPCAVAASGGQPFGSSGASDGGGSRAASTGADGKKGALGVGEGNAAHAGTVTAGNEKHLHGYESSSGSNSCREAARTGATTRGQGVGERGAPGSEGVDAFSVTAGGSSAGFQEKYVAVDGSDCCSTATQKKMGEEQSRGADKEAAERGDVDAAEAGGESEGVIRLRDGGPERMTTSGNTAEGGDLCLLGAPASNVEARTTEGGEGAEGAAAVADERGGATSTACESLVAPRHLSIGRRRGRKLGVTIEARRRELRNLASKQFCATNRFTSYRDSFTAASIACSARYRIPHESPPGSRLRFYTRSNGSGPAAGTAAGSTTAGAAASEAGSYPIPGPAHYARTSVRTLNLARCRGYIHGSRVSGLPDTVATAGASPCAGAPSVVGGVGGAGIAAGGQAAATAGNGGTSATAALVSGARMPPSTPSFPPSAGEECIVGGAAAAGRMRRPATTAGGSSFVRGTVTGGAAGGPLPQQQQLYGAGGGEGTKEETFRASKDAERKSREEEVSGSSSALRSSDQYSSASALHDNGGPQPLSCPPHLQLPCIDK